MSEKTTDRPLQRPTEAASETALARPQGAVETALTPAERAEREVAKMDEEMDAILDQRPNRAALVNPPGQALQPPAGRSVTPSVSAPIEASAFYGLALNCVVPGLGSMVHGRVGLGVAQLGMAIVSVPVLIWVSFWLALVLAVGSYIWSIASGVKFLSQPKNNWS